MASFGSESANVTEDSRNIANRDTKEDKPSVENIDNDSDDDIEGGEESDKDDFGDWKADDGEEDDETFVQSLFCSTKLSSIAELIEHDKQRYGFDLAAIVKEYSFDDFSYIKLINCIRMIVKERQGLSGVEDIVSQLTIELSKKEFLEGEKYLKPVFENDPLLFLFDEIFEFENGNEDI